MTVDQIIQRLGRCNKRIKALRDDNQRLWDSREEWKRKHSERARENTALRRRVRQLEESRDRWRAQVPRPPARTNRPNVFLSARDLEIIRSIPARD